MKKGSGKSIRRLAATFILKQNTTSVSPSRLLILNVSATPVDRLKPILAKKDVALSGRSIHRQRFG
ncbi:hypothetical protein [Lacipirellula sp.]|uniref:hypothetical protein n=1 Tax=Lacipirellula sp. TaxID=2691419 RepID=UPI003D0D55DE